MPQWFKIDIGASITWGGTFICTMMVGLQVEIFVGIILSVLVKITRNHKIFTL